MLTTSPVESSLTKIKTIGTKKECQTIMQTKLFNKSYYLDRLAWHLFPIFIIDMICKSNYILIGLLPRGSLTAHQNLQH